MGSRLGVDIYQTDGVCFITLSGIIDEDNDLSSIADRIHQPQLIIDSADVERINSCGARDWVNMLAQVERKGARCYFVRCSPAIMAQVSLVDNFIGKGQILTFFAPYYCAPCDLDSMLLIETEAVQKELPCHAPACRCDQCDQLMEFDDIESSYFSFVGTHKCEAPTPAVTEAIKRFGGKDADRLRARKPSQTHQTLNTPTSDRFASHVSVTAPSSKALRGLLTDSLSVSNVQIQEATKRQRRDNKILYLAIALLLLAVGLLGFILFKLL